MKQAQAFTPEERQRYIGCSEFGAILGVDQYRTPLDVYNLKLGLVEPFTGNRHTERGNMLEQMAAQLYTEMTDEKLLRRSQEYKHPDHSFIVGHIDRLVIGTDRIAEIKCPSVGAFRKFQREGLPKSMIAQIQGYLGLTGRSSGTWIIFCADQWDLATFDIEFDKEMYEQIIERVAEFWNENVLKQIPPKSQRSDVEKLKFVETSGELIKRNDEDFLNAAELLREAATIKAEGEYLYDLAKKEILKAIGDESGSYEGGGLRLHYKMQQGRTTFDKKRFEAEHPEIDLEPYHKQGNPFATFKPYFLEGE